MGGGVYDVILNQPRPFLSLKNKIMKINKVVKGEMFMFHVRPILNTMTAKVTRLCGSDDETVIGKISDDFQYVILPDTYLTPYLYEHGRVKVGKLKVPRHQQHDLRDFNGNI